jgi:type IV fimbrial biogenesis protein FimT
MFDVTQKNGKFISGFTLIELMVVLVIVGIVSAVAVPSYTSMMSKNRVTTAVASLHGALLLSRSEALKRGVPITICRSENTDTSSPTCATSDSLPLVNTGWADGWIIFSDNNNNGVLEPGANPAEVVISVQNRLSKDAKDISIIPNASVKQITFNSTGQVFGNLIQLTVNKPTSDSDASHDRFICIATGGRAVVSAVSC